MYRTLRPIMCGRSSTIIQRFCPKYSTKAVEKIQDDFSEENKKQLKEYETISKITPRIRIKLPQKPPFAKNLFLGIFDTDVLAYPELKKDDSVELEQNIKPVEHYIRQGDIKECNSWSREFMEKLGKEKLIALQSSQLRGGRELAIRESLRFIEALSEISLRDTVVANESLGVQFLVKWASDEQKAKFLQKLLSGQCISAFCPVIEPFSSNLDKFKRTATLSQDSKTWILNGETKYVINGSIADFFVVLAHSESLIREDLEMKQMTVFIVDRDCGGITTSKIKSVDGNVEIANIKFENTQIPIENVIGKAGDAKNMLTTVYPESQLAIALLCSNLQKRLFEKNVNHHIEVSNGQFPLYETELVRSKIGELATSIYAVDSVIYLTAGLMDIYEKQDCELESTIVKVFASEEVFQSTSRCLRLIGQDTQVDDHWCTNFHKEAIKYLNLPESQNNLKMIIALLGLQHAGQSINEDIKKLRNPLYHSAFILRKMWQQRRHADDNPKLTLNLNYYLHPSSSPAAEHLEYCVLRLQYATESLLARYGPNVVNRHSDLERLANCIIDIYAMVACVGRASRSYCIGLQHGELEMLMSDSFCANARLRVQRNVLDILGGQYKTTDEHFNSIAKKAFSAKTYFPVHPLSRNF